MFEFLCNNQPRYDYGEKSPAPPPAPSLLDAIGVSWLWKSPAPRYEGQPATVAPSSGPGLLCGLLVAPTPVYQTSSAPAPSPIPRQSYRDPDGR
jgi:hypothetical protein